LLESPALFTVSQLLND